MIPALVTLVGSDAIAGAGCKPVNELAQGPAPKGKACRITSVSEARARLAESRRRTQVIQVAALQPGLSPDAKALLRNLERSQRAATVACRKALEYAESQERRREELKRGRERALALLKHPDLADPAVREHAKRAADHAEVALALLERTLRAKVTPPA